MGRRKTKAEEEAQELGWAIAALAGLGISPDGALDRYTERSQPDFRFQLRGRTVALELTRSIDEAMAKGDGAKDQLEAAVRTKLAANNTRVQLYITMSEGLAAALHAAANRRTTIEAHAQVIADLATAIGSSTDGRWRRWGPRPPRKHADVIADPRSLKSLGLAYVTNLLIRPHSEPLAGFGGTAFSLGPALIQRVIDKKNGKLLTYRAVHADEYWLLVVASAGPGGVLDTLQLQGQTFATEFDRTFVLETGAGRCVEVSKLLSQ